MRGTTLLLDLNDLLIHISTHVPHAGHDDTEFPKDDAITGFQLTCPVRGTTGNNIINNIDFTISTHVPRAGHDYTPRGNADS